MIYLAREPVADILNTIPDNGDDNKTALEKLTGYFEPQKNLLHETYLFRQARQEPNETLGQFHVRLQNLALRCDFWDRKEFEILLQIVTNGSSSRLRKKALRDPKYTLKEMLLDGQRDETSTQQASSIEGNTEIKQEVHRVIHSQHKKGHVQTKKCHQCRGSYPHKNQTCPAAGKICHKCGKKNHFAKYCMSKTQQEPRKTQPFKRHVRPITTKSVDKAQSDSDSDFDYIYAVKQKEKPGNTVTAKISDYKCDLLVDTGASINILDEETFSQIQSDPKLEKTTVKVYPYNSNSPLKLLGKFQATVETKKRITVATFYVTEVNSGSLLGSEISQELGPVTFHINPMVSKVKDKNVKPQIASICSWISIRSTHDKSVDAALLANKEIFRGIGKLDGVQIKLNIDENVTPVVQNTRRIPFHIRKQVEEELLSLEAQGIIERVPEGQATPWISQIVAVPKKDNNSIRICVDMRSANTAIKRVRHVIPTVDEIMVQLNGAKFFSKIDFSQAYHQIELHKNSRYITTFSTHIGLFQYKRLNYGTNAAAELFQHTLQEALKGIDNVRNLADDIIIFGKTRVEHDKH